MSQIFTPKQVARKLGVLNIYKHFLQSLLRLALKSDKLQIININFWSYINNKNNFTCKIVKEESKKSHKL